MCDETLILVHYIIHFCGDYSVRGCCKSALTEQSTEDYLLYCKEKAGLKEGRREIDPYP